MTVSTRFAAALAAIVLIRGAAQAAETPTDADILYRAQIDMAEADTARGDFKTAYLTLTGIADGPDYTRLSPQKRYEVDAALAFAGLRTGHDNEAHRAAMRASGSPFARPEDLVQRLQLALETTDFADAYSTFRVLKSKVPDFAHSLFDSDISSLERGFGTLPDAASAQFEFEQYLHAIGWSPISTIFSPDVIRYHYAQHLIAHLEAGRAFAAASTITTPDVLAVLRADKRFDNLADPSAATRDVDAAARRRIQSMQQALQAEPESIEVGAELAGNLEHVGRFDDALAQVEKTIAVAEALPVPERDYDYDSQYTRALAIKSYLLFDEGRHDEALGVAAAVNGCGCSHPWASAMLRGHFLVELGRGGEALSVLAPVRESDLVLQDRASLRTWRVCAAVQAHSPDGDQSFAVLRAREAIEPVALIRGLICRNQLDGAAAVVKAGLGDPNRRALILEQMQLYKPEKTVTDFDAEMARRWNVVRMRPDVQQAVAKVGRINAYNIVKQQGDLY